MSTMPVDVSAVLKVPVLVTDNLFTELDPTVADKHNLQATG